MSIAGDLSLLLYLITFIFTLKSDNSSRKAAFY